ncbi:MAG: tetratricopeptide repeat protein [Treponema sp.]|jgi:tetratricopeptide (TPR) repeat protein|nr:tetratricopeptide repeat protein [Treponema sp.]
MTGDTNRSLPLWTAIFLILAACAGTGKALQGDPEIAGVSSRILSPEAEELVRTGILYHDRGDYETALDYYRKALELAPDHPVVCYEMAFSYLYMGDSETALQTAERGIAAAVDRDMGDLIPSLFDLKGSALDNLGRSEEAVDVYLEAINKYGAADTFLYYNLGLTYYRIGKSGEALDALVQGLQINPNHSSSNYLLGRICMEKGMKTQAFYSLLYLLLLEPNTDRAAESYNTILHMLAIQEETIGFRNNGTFTPADIIISLSFTLDEANAQKDASEKTAAKLYYIFTTLEDQKNAGKIGRSAGDELWWDFYSSFFYRIAKSDYFGTFSRYIGIASDPQADEWIETGRDEIEGLFTWLNEYPGPEAE